jgi:hypothetical protein
MSASTAVDTQDTTAAGKKRQRRQAADKRKKRKRRRGVRKEPTKTAAKSGGASDYPRHAVRKALRIPQAILDQNAGKACTESEARKILRCRVPWSLPR